ncbi:hypothetical protein JKP88DRAFT_246094 [Tribonema minus]|uniref:Uncharacterized protein n=1 Tax=Tribonema minus TaxID=303371 RepID=A0A835YU75_9STRA|nr:hypothetical protein JKP88DRAFT_246094 [Tribonema minus]
MTYLDNLICKRAGPQRVQRCAREPEPEADVTIGGPLGACRLCIDLLLETLKREPAAAVYTNLSVNYAHPPAAAAAAAAAAPSSMATASAEATGISVDRHTWQPLPPLPAYPPEMRDLIQPLNMRAPTHPVAAAVAGAAGVTTITVSIPDNMVGRYSAGAAPPSTSCRHVAGGVV